MIDVLIKKKFRKNNTEACVLPFAVSSPVPVRFVSGAVPGSTHCWLHTVAPINRLVSQPYRRSTDRGVHTPTAPDRHTSTRVVTQLQTAVSLNASLTNNSELRRRQMEKSIKLVCLHGCGKKGK